MSSQWRYSDWRSRADALGRLSPRLRSLLLAHWGRIVCQEALLILPPGDGRLREVLAFAHACMRGRACGGTPATSDVADLIAASVAAADSAAATATAMGVSTAPAMLARAAADAVAMAAAVALTASRCTSAARLECGANAAYMAARTRAVVWCAGQVESASYDQAEQAAWSWVYRTYLHAAAHEELPPGYAIPRVWRTPTVMSIVQHILDTGDESVGPVLADALQDAGCEDEGILTHLREDVGEVTPADWVVQLLAGAAV
jgi:hypothetical protein